MGIYWIRKWMVLKGKVDAHEDLMKRWYAYIKPKTDKQIIYFDQMFGPIQGRAKIWEFDSLTDYEQFQDTLFQSEETVKFRDEWLSYIEHSSYQAVFWKERKN